MKKITLSPSGKEIECLEGDTILAAIEKAGLALPNNCRAGACGECKLKVVKGEFDQGLVLDMALSPEERDSGYGLMCMAKMTSDSIEIEWGEADARPKLFPPQEDISFFVTEKLLVNNDIMKLRLRPLGKPVRFWPGQYMHFHHPDFGDTKRAYSIANIPNEEGELIFYISKVNEGKLSNYIHQTLNTGDLLRLSGPYGTFIGDPSAQTPVLCLCHGSGLAPILSLAQAALLRGGFRNPAHVLFSAKTKKDIFDLGNLQYLDTKFRNFSFKHTLTQEKNPDGYEGRINELLPKLYPDLSKHSVYIAGSPDFVETQKQVVLNLGAMPELVHVEGFSDQSHIDY